MVHIKGFMFIRIIFYAFSIHPHQNFNLFMYVPIRKSVFYDDETTKVPQELS